ncbi:GRP family sugar transporter [Metabacillus sp. GX 13764]|uniref:GRP family sugar transporter n=1 Tax=Metabacillus kandeliae TaxID=2900151 RepID=UPI001E2AA7A6|nr:GRP family sugar transporter [Metabacillus kandeliae]MCD7033249.1 GRP family sugar transporter [Metabacillus kandeliae]
MAGILLALAGAAAWGSVLLICMRIGGNPQSQMFGISIGTILLSLCLFFYQTPLMNNVTWVLGFVSGFALAIGLYNQLISARLIGVSKSVPFIAGVQLLGAAACSVIILKEWSSLYSLALGMIAIILIIVGLVFILLWTSTTVKKERFSRAWVKMLLSALGFIGYFGISNVFDIDGWGAMLPMALGLFAGTCMLAFRKKPKFADTLRNMVSGAVFSIGSLCFLFSLSILGAGPSFSVSQVWVALSTAGGLYLLKEKSTRKQAAFLLLSSVLIVAGGVALGYSKG